MAPVVAIFSFLSTMMQLAAAGQPNAAAALPDVESVLTKATDKAHDFAEQAMAMQRRVTEQQEKSRAALAAQKASYEAKLASQAAQSDTISANNTAINSANEALQKSNTILEAELMDMQGKNAHMRQALQEISNKVEAAKLFIVDSMKATDDTNAEELHVLAPTTPKPTLDHFLAMAGASKVSLLQLSSPRSQGPEDLVSVLSKSLADIANAEVEGAAELKAHFLASFEEGQKRQVDLNATHAELLKRQTDLKERQGKLMEAKNHLLNTNKQLTGRLHGLRVFARKLDSVAASSLSAELQVKAANLARVLKENAGPSQATPTGVPNQETPIVTTTLPSKVQGKTVNGTAVPAQSQILASRKHDAPVAAAPVAAAPLAQKAGHKVETDTKKAAKGADIPRVALKKPATPTGSSKELKQIPSKATDAGSALRPPHTQAPTQAPKAIEKATVHLMQESATQKVPASEGPPAAEKPSQWSKWFSALR